MYAFGKLGRPSDYSLVAGLGGLCALSLKGNVKRNGGCPNLSIQPAKNEVHPDKVGATAASFLIWTSILFAKNFPNSHYLKTHDSYLVPKKNLKVCDCIDAVTITESVH
jgi:hypothetical protein